MVVLYYINDIKNIIIDDIFLKCEENACSKIDDLKKDEWKNNIRNM